MRGSDMSSVNCAFRLSTNRQLSFFLLIAILMAAVALPLQVYAGDPRDGKGTPPGSPGSFDPNEDALTIFTPFLTVGNDTLLPVAGDSADLVLSMCKGPQKWTLLKEYTLWANMNRFGYYTDLGVGQNQVVLFRGPNGYGTLKTTTLTTGTPIGLWLLNDTAGDTTYTVGDSYLFSERSLTYGSLANEHQWFKVYNVSAYKGQNATFIFNTFTFNDTSTGGYDYLIYIDDDHSSANFDHNDMIVGLTCVSSPPQVQCPTPFDIVACETGAVCIPGFVVTDPDNDIASITVIGGTMSGDTVCFTPSGAGPHAITVIAMDSTGMADTCSTTINIALNSPPVCQLPNDTSIYQCVPEGICLPILSYDPDGNYLGCEVISGPGSLEKQIPDNRPTIVRSDAASPVPEWCYLPTVDTSFWVVIRCLDTCGSACIDSFHVTIDLNESPVCHTPNDTTIMLCELTPVCLPVYCTDADNNLTHVSPILLTPKGTLANGQWCYTPAGNETVQVGLRCEDSCGRYCEKVFNVTFVVNQQAPVCTVPSDTTIRLCTSAEVCLPVSCSDPDGNLLPHQPSIVTGPGTIINGHWCYTPGQSGLVTVTTRCTDACGLYCEKTFAVTFIVNTPPTCHVPHDTTIFQCSPSEICLPVSCSDPDGDLLANQPTLVSAKGSISNGNWCYLPSANEDLVVTVKCQDTCGTSCTSSFNVHVRVNRAPVCVTPYFDSTYFLCAPTQVCRPVGCTDPDGNLLPGQPIIISGPGAVINGQWCFTPALTDDTILVHLQCQDSCGATCEQTIHLVFQFNRPPTCVGPTDTTIKLCAFSEICLPVGCLDANGNLLAGQPTLVSSPGTIKNGHWCYTPTLNSESLTITTQCADACGAVCTKTFHVSVKVNQAPPLGNCPPSIFARMCDPGPVCFNFATVDPDGDKVVYSVISGKGSIDANGLWCYTPTASETFVLTIGIKDTTVCGGTKTCQTDVMIKINQPPVAIAPADTTIISCNLSTICRSGFGYSDPDNNLASVSAVGGVFNVNQVCFTPVLGDNTLTMIVADSCGKADTAVTHVYVTDSTCAPTCPRIRIAKMEKVLQGQMTCVPITMEGHSFTMGGFDLLVWYDNSALTLSSIAQGQLLTDCKWEYFTYRLGPFGACGSGCPSGLVRVIAIAETNNGASHPSCWGPPGSASYELAKLCFLVSNDRTLECQYVPIRFFWIDCGDNAVSTVVGDTEFVSNDIFDYSNPVSIADPSADFPTYFGVQSECLVGGGSIDKPAPVRCIDFYNGGVDIICAVDIDSRGDINLNGLAYEIADAVMFSNYFIRGLTAFGTHTQGSIAATDVNADGVPLSIADLVYLVRVVVGDAVAYPKLAPVDMTVAQENDVVSVSGEVGAAFLTFDGNVQPRLLADQMEMIYAYDGKVTRVLVYSYNRGAKFSGSFIEADCRLASVEMATYEGAPIAARLMPTQFALSQNYPNPFNPTTSIEFSLAQSTDYTLRIFNVSGQEVAVFSGHGEPGTSRVEWNASNMASGIYLYRLETSEFTQTRKMVLLK
jgi:hypothetical protein